MIAYFNSLEDPVAGCTVFRDHEKANRFYVLPYVPQIARDARTGEPIFFFHLIARDVDIVYASGTASASAPAQDQMGQLAMQVDLSLPPAKMEGLKTRLRQLLERERGRASLYNRLFGVRTGDIEPQVSYVQTWLEGGVRVDVVVPEGPTFKLNSSPELKPSLYGTNTASYWATFGQEGAQLMWIGLGGRRTEDQPPPTTLSALPIVYYNLKFAAKIPAIKVTVTAHGSSVYDELRTQTRVIERTSNGTWSYPQIAELTKSLRANRSIEIKWDDEGLPETAEGTEVKNEIEANLITMVTNRIIEIFFAEYAVKGLQEGDLGEDPFLHSRAGSGKPGNRLWLREFKEEFVSDISFTLSRSKNVIRQVNPNALLETVVSAEELAARLKIIDVGSPEIEVLQVPIYTNADFANDKIANITVDVVYKQHDTQTMNWIEKRETFVFQTGREVFTYRTRLARDAQGRLIDKYDVTARINYIGTAQAPPPITMKDLSERALTISYERLGYVKVDVQAGDIDWREIKTVFVDLEYEPAAGSPDARRQLKLTQDTPTATWSCSKRGAASNSYRYTVKYVMKDDSEQTGASKRDDRGTLVIHDVLAGRLRRTFDVIMDPATVKAVLMRVRYHDARHGIDETARNTFTATGSWDYSRSIMDGAPQTIEWSALLQYSDGAVEETPWKSLAPDDDSPVVSARRHKFAVMIDGSRLNWTKWSTVYVYLEYEDRAHNYNISTEAPLRVTRDAALHRFDVLAFSPQARGYRYRATFVPETGDPIDVPPGGDMATSDKGLLLLHTLVS